METVKESTNLIKNVNVFCPFCSSGKSDIYWEDASAWLNTHILDNHHQKLMQHMIDNNLDKVDIMDVVFKPENLPMKTRVTRLKNDILGWGGWIALQLMFEDNTEITEMEVVE